MTDIVPQDSIEFFYDYFYKGHLNDGKTVEYVMTKVHQIDGLKVELCITSEIIKRQCSPSTPKFYNHIMSYDVVWKDSGHTLFEYQVINNIKDLKKIRDAILMTLLSIHRNLPLMKLNRYSGKFDTTIVCEGFGDDYLSDEACCVCHEKTITKTTCFHSICIDCCNKMKKVTKSRDLKCPLCRSIFMIQDDDDEYDSDLNFSDVTSVISNIDDAESDDEEIVHDDETDDDDDDVDVDDDDDDQIVHQIVDVIVDIILGEQNIHDETVGNTQVECDDAVSYWSENTH